MEFIDRVAKSYKIEKSSEKKMENKIRFILAISYFLLIFFFEK